MNFGFSYIGVIFLLMLMVPNIIWIKHKPKDYDKYAQNEDKILLAFERVGEVSVSCVAVVFCDFNIHTFSMWSMWLVLGFVLMLLYEVYWIRYFKSEKTMRDFYSGLLFVPVSGATLPVVAFFVLGIYGKNPLMIIATIILGIGHIGIHLNHKKEIG